MILEWMTHDSLLGGDWPKLVGRLGGATVIAADARQTRAFRRARGFETAIDLLRMILAYCLGDKGLRLTAAWAASIGLADVSNVALLKRLRNCGDWLGLLVGRALATATPEAAHGRLIRIVDATTVPKAGADPATSNKLWRIHSAFDLPCERFGFFELTDERGGETLDRVPGRPDPAPHACSHPGQRDQVAGMVASREGLPPPASAAARSARRDPCGRRRCHRTGRMAQCTLARCRWRVARSSRGAAQGENRWAPRHAGLDRTQVRCSRAHALGRDP